MESVSESQKRETILTSLWKNKVLYIVLASTTELVRPVLSVPWGLVPAHVSQKPMMTSPGT